MKIKDALNWAEKELKKAKIKSYKLDALVLLSFVLNKPKEEILASQNTEISPKRLGNYKSLIYRRSCHEPIAYLTGQKEFFGFNFKINKSAFIPRPETELLIEEVLKEIIEEEKRKAKQTGELFLINKNTKLPFNLSFKKLIICDVGTGSGNIAITLAKYLPRSKIFAIDISEKALRLAKENAKLNKVKNITFLKGNLMEPITLKSDIICANLPYISKKEIKNLPQEIKNYEPKESWFGGKDGLEVYRCLIPQLKSKIKPGGKVFLEIGWNQSKKIIELLKKYFKNAHIKIKKDLSKRDRIVIVRLRKEVKKLGKN